MAYRKTATIAVVFIFVLNLLLLSSCEKFSGDQEIPAYLEIDTVMLSTLYSEQGSASHSICDAWVYLDGEILGTFELPARFPVLANGKHTLTVLPGIKKDGIASTRVEYPYYNVIEKQIPLAPDSTTSVTNLKSTYKSSTKFLWMEDFEDVALSLDTTKRSTVKMKNTDPDSENTFEGQHSGEALLTSDTSYFEAVTHAAYSISTATPTYLELNFKSNNTLTVGVYLYGSANLYEVPIITLFSTDGRWKKIYIDLSTSINAYSGMSTFRVYFSTYKDSGVSTGEIFLDNCKLVTQ